jgi:hypothetical protein
LLLAGAVQLDQPVDGWHLLEQQRIIRLALFEGGCARPRSPADLAFHFRDILLDPASGRLRLFRLRVGKELRGFPVHEPRFQAAVHGQHEHDQPDEGNDVFAEQAVPTEPALAHRRHDRNSLALRDTYEPSPLPSQGPRRRWHRTGADRIGIGSSLNR